MLTEPNAHLLQPDPGSKLSSEVKREDLPSSWRRSAIVFSQLRPLLASHGRWWPNTAGGDSGALRRIEALKLLVRLTTDVGHSNPFIKKSPARRGT